MIGIDGKSLKLRVGLRAASVAGVLAVVAAVGGIGATSAVAAPTCPSNAVKAIEGRGSTLQRGAQEAWTGRFVPAGMPLTSIPHEVKSGGYAAACPSGPSANYTATGDRDGLAAFLYLGGPGVIENGSHGESHPMSFVASDEAPNKSMIETAESATTGGVASGANALIIPVIQSSIAVIVHPPSGCTLTLDATHGISYAELNKLFSGTMKSWSELASHSGTCTGSITRVVREELSNTTLQFKNYLSVLETTLAAEGPGCFSQTGHSTWAELRPIENPSTGEPNTIWPECTGRSAVVKKPGGGLLAEYVAKNAGTVGYALLADAKSKSATVARLENQKTGGYALPETSIGESANCGSSPYVFKEGGSGESVDWSNVFGAWPTIGGTSYPLCALTYDMSWSSYEKAGYANPAAQAADVKDYMNFILNEGASIGHYYAPLPSAKEHDVLGAAKLAASKIG
jgi:ABC-type phosphate transport system substrate-binding protein